MRRYRGLRPRPRQEGQQSTAGNLAVVRIDADVFGAIINRRVMPPPPPEYPTLVDELAARLAADDTATWIPESGRGYADKRIRAGFLICPAQGDLMSATILKEMTAPVSIWWIGDDDQTPAETNALRYAAPIPGASEHCADPAAGHYVFVKDLPGAEPISAHVATAAVTFFRDQLQVSR